MELQEEENVKRYPICWEMLCNISSDGPNINHAIYRILNKKLKDMDLKGLLPFFSCTVHVVHNGFHKGIEQLT